METGRSAHALGPRRTPRSQLAATQRATAAPRPSACVSQASAQPRLRHQPRREARPRPRPALPATSRPRPGPRLDPPAAPGLCPRTGEVCIECIELILKGPSLRPYTGRKAGRGLGPPFWAGKVLCRGPCSQGYRRPSAQLQGRQNRLEDWFHAESPRAPWSSASSPGNAVRCPGSPVGVFTVQSVCKTSPPVLGTCHPRPRLPCSLGE